MRRRYDLGPDENVLAAYLALWRRQLRHGPAYLGQFWRCWRAAERSKAPLDVRREA